MKTAYQGVIGYYQGELDSASNELKTKSQKIEMDQYDAEMEKNREAVNAYRSSHPLQSPPVYCCDARRNHD